MRQINVAYVTLVRFLQPDNKRLQFESSLTSKMSSADSLTQEEIDGMVHAIGFEGPMDRFLCGVDTARGILWLVFVVGVVIRLVMLLVSGDFHGILSATDLSKFWDFLKDPVLLAVLGLLLVGEFFVQRNLERRP